MTFDDALSRFPDSSVDLLHIDGLHTYKAVRHDFECWSEKLSDRAVVLFHDCSEIQATFGVWRFWHRIARVRPSFTFHHSHGLGVLAWGTNVPADIEPLFRQNPVLAGATRHFFENLGEAAFRKEKVEITAPTGPTDEELNALSEDRIRIRPRGYARQWACYIRAVARSKGLWPR